MDFCEPRARPHVRPFIPPRVQSTLSRRRGGRRRIWTPSPVTSADRERGRELIALYGPDRHASMRVIADYRHFCAISGFDPTDPEACAAVLGQMDNSGLSAGSLDTYMSIIKKVYRAPAHDASYAAGVHHADEEGGHAPDLSDEVLWKYVEAANAIWQPLLYILAVYGLRIKACAWLTQSRTIFPAWDDWGSFSPEIIITVDKQRRRRCHRTTLRLPLEWDILPPPPCEETLRFFSEGEPKDRLWPGITATAVNTELRRLSLELGLPRPTTYSFRRAYVNRVIPFVTSKKELTLYTLHFSEETVEAFYRRNRQDMLAAVPQPTEEETT